MIARDCRHLRINASQRATCTSPGLVQLGELTQEVCETCGFFESAELQTSTKQDSPSLSHQLSPELPVEQVMDIMRQPPREQHDGWWNWNNTQQAFRQLADEAIERFSDHSDHWDGRGIVVVGGGKYLVSAYVTIRVLRHVGCTMPIELWHLDDEVDPAMELLLRELGVVCRNAEEHHRNTQSSFRFMPTWWKGWQLKSYAIYHCRFAELLLLDADSYPTRDPSYLFELDTFRQRGAIFWPDLYSAQLCDNERATRAFGFEVDNKVWSESGQLMVDKIACEREFSLALHYNSHADFTYRIVHGDKDTFPLAWRRLSREFGRLWPTCGIATKALLQYDEHGQTLFQHRIHDKFRLVGDQFDSTCQLTPGNCFIPELQHEVFCVKVLNELRNCWNPAMPAV